MRLRDILFFGESLEHTRMTAYSGERQLQQGSGLVNLRCPSSGANERSTRSGGMSKQRADVSRYVYDRAPCGRWSVIDSLTDATLAIHDSEQLAVSAALRANEQACQSPGAFTSAPPLPYLIG